MGRHRKPIYMTPEELTPEELAQYAADDEELSKLIVNGLFCPRKNNPLRLSRADFYDDEQADAWRQALQQLENKDNPSNEGFRRFLRLGKPLSPRVAMALDKLLFGRVVIPVTSMREEDLDLPPGFFGEMVVQPWPKPKWRKGPPHRPSDLGRIRRAYTAAADVKRHRAAGSTASDSVLISRAAKKHGVRRESVVDAFETGACSDYKTPETSKSLF